MTECTCPKCEQIKQDDQLMADLGIDETEWAALAVEFTLTDAQDQGATK